MARWRFGRGWSEKALQRYLDELPHCPCNSDAAPKEMTRENGWDLDPYEADLGDEPPGPPLPDALFARARLGLIQYRFSDPRMAEAHFDPHVPLPSGACYWR